MYVVLYNYGCMVHKIKENSPHQIPLCGSIVFTAILIIIIYYYLYSVLYADEWHTAQAILA